MQNEANDRMSHTLVALKLYKPYYVLLMRHCYTAKWRYEITTPEASPSL